MKRKTDVLSMVDAKQVELSGFYQAGVHTALHPNRPRLRVCLAARAPWR